MAAGIPYILNDPTRPPAAAIKAALRDGLRHPRAMAEMAKIVTGSAATTQIDARFRHPVVRGGLLSLAAGRCPGHAQGQWNQRDVPGDRSPRRRGLASDRRRADSSPTALVACLEEYGGRVRIKAEVA